MTPQACREQKTRIRSNILFNVSLGFQLNFLQAEGRYRPPVSAIGALAQEVNGRLIRHAVRPIVTSQALSFALSLGFRGFRVRWFLFRWLSWVDGLRQARRRREAELDVLKFRLQFPT